MGSHRPSGGAVELIVRHAVADSQWLRLGLRSHHCPVAGALHVEPDAQQGAGIGVAPIEGGGAAVRGAPAGAAHLHLLPRGLGHPAGAVDRDRAQFTFVAVDQRRVRPAAQYPGQPPRKIGSIEDPGVQPQRPHRRDQMGRIAHQQRAIDPPAFGDPMMDLIGDTAEDPHPIDRADEAEDLFAQRLIRGFLRRRRQRKQETPAVRLADHDHPFLGVGEISEIRVVARIGDIEIHLQVEQHVPHVERLSCRPNAAQRAHGAAAAVATQQIAARKAPLTVRRRESRDDALLVLTEGEQPVVHQHPVRPRGLDLPAQDRLEMMLGQIDDERIARLIAQHVGHHRASRRVGLAIEVADLFHSQRALEHLVRHAVAAEYFQRAGEDGAGLGVERERPVLFEQEERYAVVRETERGGQSDRAGADDEHGIHLSPPAKRRSRG